MSGPNGRTIANYRCISRLMVVLSSFCVLLAGTQWAISAGGQFSTPAKYALLMDASTGSILYQKNADELMAPASMSKLVTLAVVFRALKAGKYKLSDEFKMSVNAWRTGGAPSRTASMFVPVHKTATLEQLIRGIIVQSGNDAAISIAENMAGSEAAFAKRMTAEARRIGLEKATFGNATGLPHPKQLMTAMELAKLARFLIRTYPEYYPWFAQKIFKYRRHRFFSRNPLLYANIGVDGLKTGSLKASGHGMVASAKQGKRRLIAVLNGLRTKKLRKDEVKKIIEWGFKSLGEFRLFDAGQVVGHAKVWGGETMYVPLVGAADGVIISLPKYPIDQRIRAAVVYKKPLKAPIRKGDEVAHLKVVSSSSAISIVPLYAGRDVKRAGIASRGLDSLLHMALGWLL